MKEPPFTKAEERFAAGLGVDNRQRPSATLEADAVMVS